MSFKLDSRDTGERTPSFDRFQLTITGCQISKKYTCTLQNKAACRCQLISWGIPHGRLHHRRRRAYASTSNTTSRDNHEKINSWVPFTFLYEYGAPLGGPSVCRSSSVGSLGKLLRLALIQLLEVHFLRNETLRM